MWTRVYWQAVGERMIRGFAIAALTVIGGDAMNAFDADWVQVLGFGLGGAGLSLLFSLAGQVASGDGPSFSRAEKISPRHSVPDQP